MTEENEVLTIDPTIFTNARTQEDQSGFICTKNGEQAIYMGMNQCFPDDDMSFLVEVVKLVENDHVESEALDKVCEFLEEVAIGEEGLRIADTFYSWRKVKKFINHD